jgi:hypothetical protein
MHRSQVRSDVYKILCGVVSYPDESFYASVREGRLYDGLRHSLNLLDEGYFSGCLEDIRSGCSEGTSVTLEGMAAEYERLFGGSPEGLGDESGTLAAVDRALSLLRDRKGKGMKFSDDGACVYHKTGWPSADSLRMRFGWMGCMAELESKAACSEKIDLEEMQLAFASKFISGVVSAFCEKLIGESAIDFYRAAGMLIREFIAFEENYLGIPDEMDTS